MDGKNPNGASAQELYRAGRRFRVVQPGAQLVHGNLARMGVLLTCPSGPSSRFAAG